MSEPWPRPATAIDDDEGDRQLILLAIAELALRRPGWDWTLGRLASRLCGREEFAAFKATGQPPESWEVLAIELRHQLTQARWSWGAIGTGAAAGAGLMAAALRLYPW